MTNHYHNLMNFPPKMFEGQTLLDFGAGSGEYTVFLENWGAKCTLVEINIKAHEISKKIFENYAVNYSENEFINTSIYDFVSNKKFDIVHSRGVLAHTYNKELGFKKCVTSRRLRSTSHGTPTECAGYSQTVWNRQEMFTALYQ